MLYFVFVWLWDLVSLTTLWTYGSIILPIYICVCVMIVLWSVVMFRYVTCVNYVKYMEITEWWVRGYRYRYMWNNERYARCMANEWVYFCHVMVRYMCTYRVLCTLSYIVCRGLTYRLKRLSDSWILRGGRASGTWTSKDKMVCEWCIIYFRMVIMLFIMMYVMTWVG